MKILVNGCSHSACGPTNIATISNRLVPVQDSRKSWVTKLSSDLNLKTYTQLNNHFSVKVGMDLGMI